MVKNFILIDFLLSEFPDMISLNELQISSPLFLLLKFILPANFDCEKVEQDDVFTIKMYCISSQNDPNIAHTN
jgi:hypothetical protein